MRAALLCTLVALAPAARADDGLRCGARLVAVGEREGEVAAKCGPPTRAERYELRSRIRGARLTVDVWTYDWGPHDFVRTLRFEDGVLRAVEVGDYGH